MRNMGSARAKEDNVPLHLQSITNNDQKPEYLTDLLMMAGESPDELFASAEEKFM